MPGAQRFGKLTVFSGARSNRRRTQVAHLIAVYEVPLADRLHSGDESALSHRRVNILREFHLVSRRDLLGHSFYQRWVAAELSIGELRDYTCQYAHVVAALPKWLRRAAAATPEHAVQLERHAVEEEGHVALWHKFAKALGITMGELAIIAPNPATAELLRRGDELSGQEVGVAVVWALEAQTPGVSAEKLCGLQAHYGIERGSGGEYFDVHSSRDLVHRAELDAVIVGLGKDHFLAARRAVDAILDGLWDLLTSVERAA